MRLIYDKNKKRICYIKISNHILNVKVYLDAKYIQIQHQMPHKFDNLSKVHKK